MATAEDILARLSARKRGVPVQPVQIAPIEPVSEQFGLPQPVSEIPLGMVEQPDTAEDILQRLSQRKAIDEQIVEQPPEETGFFRGLQDLFTGKSRITPETEAVPELATEIFPRGIPISLKELKFAGKMLFTATDEEKVNLIKVNIPDAKIRKDEKGNTFVILPDGTETVLNKPGASLQDAIDVAGDIATFFLAAKFGGRFKTVPGRILAGGGAAAVTEAGRQAVVQQLGGREELSPVDIGLAGVTGGVGEVIAPIAKGIRKLAGITPGVKRIPGVKTQEDILLGVSKEELPAAQAAVREADILTEQTGIRLFPGQKTLDPATLRKQRFLPEFSAASKKAARELEAQNKEVFDEVDRVFNLIAPPEAIETAAGRVRDVAELAIQAKKDIRKEFSAPIYNEAKKDLKPVALPETRALIAGLKEDLPPKELAVMDTIENMLFPPGTKAQKFDPLLAPGVSVVRGFPTKKLHRAKIAIDDLILKKGEGSLGNTQKRELIDIQNTFLEELDTANPKYAEARLEFAKNSPAVDDLKKSIIGKITKLDDIQIERIGETLFKPGNTVGTIKRAKKIIEEQDPQAWRDITRSVFESRLGNIRIDAADVTTENVPAQILQKVFGNLKQQKILFAGLDTETAKNIRQLQSALKRAKRGRPGGSETAARGPLEEELIREGAPIKGIVRASLDRPAKSMGALAANLLTLQTKGTTRDEALQLMGEVYFNPKWQPRLARLRTLNPDSPEAVRLFRSILKDASKASLQPVKTEILENK